MSSYAAIHSYLKLLLANVANLCDAVDSDLADSAYLAAMNEFADGKRGDIPEGRVLGLSNCGAGSWGWNQSLLTELAQKEFKIVKNGVTFISHNEMSEAFDQMRSAYTMLGALPIQALREGVLPSLPCWPEFGEFIDKAASLERWTGKIEAPRRPRLQITAEAARQLLVLVRVRAVEWRWKAHNDRIDRIKQSKRGPFIYEVDFTPPMRRDVSVVRTPDEKLLDSLWRDDRDRFAIARLVQSTFRPLLNYLPKDCPSDELVDVDFQAMEWRKLLERVQATVSQLEAAGANSSKPATATKPILDGMIRIRERVWNEGLPLISNSTPAMTAATVFAGQSEAYPPAEPENVERPATGNVNDNTTKGETEPQFIFRPDGNGYYVEGFGESGHYQQLKGLADLWRLVQSPRVGVSMLELDAGPGAIRAAGDGRSRQPIMESDELRQLNTDRKRYQTEVDEAENDIERADSQEKLDGCIEAIRRVTGLNGKSRDLNNPNDNLRAKIAGRIATACNTMQTNCPQLAQHFGDTCSANGALYVYSPGIAGVGWDTSKKQ